MPDNPATVRMRAPKFGDRVVTANVDDEQRLRDEFGAYRDGEKPPKKAEPKDKDPKDPKDPKDSAPPTT